MSSYKILMGNLGYMRGLNGTLSQHFLYAHRHIYNSIATQKKSQQQLAAILDQEDPDLCCFVEIDKGSSDSANFNQLEALISHKYPFADIENKYGEQSRLRALPFSKGKSNGFLSKKKLEYQKIYFNYGTKRLIYKINIEADINLFFAHFSLKKEVRAKQLLEIRQLLRDTSGRSIVLGDFNILSGFQELAPLLHENNLRVLNKEDVPTFRFHRMERAIDLCICSEALADAINLRVIPQPYSDHAALLLELRR